MNPHIEERLRRELAALPDLATHATGLPVCLRERNTTMTEPITIYGASDDLVLWFDGQAHATAALVEQQRIANLIALGYDHTSPSGDVVGEARRALVERTGADRHQLRSEVAAALGIEVQP